MTQRDWQKKGRTAAATGGSRTTKKPATALEQLERERDELRARLAAAEEHIKLLESQRLEVLNRIDWVIDSIHNVLERQN